MSKLVWRLGSNDVWHGIAGNLIVGVAYRYDGEGAAYYIRRFETKSGQKRFEARNVATAKKAVQRHWSLFCASADLVEKPKS